MLPTIHQQCGQSTVEFAIVSAAVIPFILALGLMAKFTDIQHATAQASQYAVWEKALNPAKPAAQVSDDLRSRFFTRTDRSLANREVVTDAASEYRPYWSDHQNRPLLKHLSDVSNTDSEPGLRPAQQIFDLAAKVFISGMGLNEQGMWRVRVQVPLQRQSGKLLSPFESLDIIPQGSAALFTDSWAAANRHSVKHTLSDWKVTTTDPIVTPAVQALAYTFNLLDLEADPRSFENKNIDHDVIPCEYRLIRGRPSC